MDHLLNPLETLRADCFYFAREEDIRFFLVAVDDALREPAISILENMQFAPDCRQPVLVLRSADVTHQTWHSWNDQLVATYNQTAAALLSLGQATPGLNVADGEPLIGVKGFARTLKSALDNLTDPSLPIHGLIVIMDLSGTRDHLLMNELVRLIQAPALAKARWVFMEAQNVVSSALRDSLPDSATLRVACRIDPERQEAELADLIDAMASAPPKGYGPVRAGAAGPQVLPPNHPTDSPETVASTSPNSTGPLLSGIKALARGNIEEAIRAQAECVDLCLQHGNIPMAIEMELLLATYAVQALGEGKARAAMIFHVLDRALTRATDAKLESVGAKVALVAGVVAGAAGELTLQAAYLRRGASLAKAAKVLPLAIEALRLLGEATERAGLIERTVEVWREAMDLANSLTPLERSFTSASEVDKRLRSYLKESEAGDSGGGRAATNASGVEGSV